MMNDDHFHAPSTGYDEFDKQHQALISILGKLAGTRDAYEANKLTLDLVARWQEHHRSEERWMRSVGFALEGDHRREHQKLSILFANLRHLASSLSFLNELPDHTELILARLRDHIVTHDLQFRSFPQAELARK